MWTGRLPGKVFWIRPPGVMLWGPLMIHFTAIKDLILYIELLDIQYDTCCQKEVVKVTMLVSETCFVSFNTQVWDSFKGLAPNHNFFSTKILIFKIKDVLLLSILKTKLLYISYSWLSERQGAGSHLLSALIYGDLPEFDEGERNMEITPSSVMQPRVIVSV